MSSLFDLTGKVALITGSTKGIGKAIADRMSEHGARVVISSRKADVCDQVAAELTAKGREAFAMAANVTRPAELKALYEAVMAHWGRIDILVCNAAVNPYYGSMLGLPDDAFDHVMNANVKSIHLLSAMVLPQMVERRDGAIICISSLGGILGTDKLSVYNVSKAAELQMMRNIATEFGKDNIRANSIAPGLVRTDFAKALWSNPAMMKARTATTPMARIGEPDEVAGIAVFLASKAAGFVNGQSIVVDGGRSVSSLIPDNPETGR
jgi:NAD(P)-dependent dehydrogenase (short-subunit alcohol dehydrogenase family)